MGIRVDVLPLDVNTPGQGLLRITGWEGTSEGLQCSLQSSQSHEFLHDGGHWAKVAHWFRLDGMNAVAGAPAIETRIGPNLINPLLQASGTATFRIEVSNPQTGRSDLGMVRINSAIIASVESGPALEKSPPPAPLPSATVIVQPPAVTTPEPVPVVTAEPVPEAAPAPQPAPVAPPPKAPAKQGQKWLLPLLALILLALAAGGGWWWFNRSAGEATAAVPPEDKPVAQADAAKPCSLESMQGQTSLAFLQSCIQSKPDSAALLEVISLAKANDQCDVAQRLYANRANAGDIQIATAYAHEYDPKYHQPSNCFKAPEAATAASWYETILSFDENNAEAKQRYEELKP
ncbi:hypothetical protein [Pseudomonas putida]|uniref:hypothetical protein n=1 Tax=Pseudomonas putida TaxID=303 RepID=UPI00157633C2|nr:hypothetical protein [Pseudomonas putida]NTY94112.1 hypothetical protein [Pseudomonas putida]NTY99289.1 hypothetical protein [Pseudomonas putida]NTZ24703.1 hypothetical protein [Pseudomonas putida]NTZ57374.1 hypothetical protein [Pseudomonas putida]NTZ67915.1 hypothetical protein [Pseudomonas putida]